MERGPVHALGEELDEDRLAALMRPGNAIDTVITADTYGLGAPTALWAAPSQGCPARICAVGAMGHDFYDGERDGARAFRA